MLVVSKLLKFGNFDFKAHLSCLNGFMMLMALHQYILWQHLEGKCCCKVVF